MFKSFVFLNVFLALFCLSSFGQGSRNEVLNPTYGDHIVRFYPLSVFETKGVGIAISYEMLLTEEKKIGLHLPLYLMIGNGDSYAGQDREYRILNYYGYFAPGIKFYPSGQKEITYAIGPSAFIGWGGGQEWRIDNQNFGTYRLMDKSLIQLGMHVNNYLNFQITKSVNFGAELGLGVLYVERYKYKADQIQDIYNNRVRLSVQLGFSFGYRF